MHKESGFDNILWFKHKSVICVFWSSATRSQTCPNWLNVKAPVLNYCSSHVIYCLVPFHRKWSRLTQTIHIGVVLRDESTRETNFNHTTNIIQSKWMTRIKFRKIIFTIHICLDKLILTPLISYVSIVHEASVREKN